MACELDWGEGRGQANANDARSLWGRVLGGLGGLDCCRAAFVWLRTTSPQDGHPSPGQPWGD